MADPLSTPQEALPAPLSPLQIAAAILHERYTAFVGAGFTEAQALTLVGMAVTPTAAEGDAS